MNNKLLLSLLLPATAALADNKSEVTVGDLKAEVIKLASLKAKNFKHLDEAKKLFKQLLNDKDTSFKQARRALMHLMLIIDSEMEPVDPLVDGIKSYINNDKYGEKQDERAFELLMHAELEILRLNASEVCAGLGGVETDTMEKNDFDLDCNDLRTLLGMGQKALAAKDKNRKQRYEEQQAFK